MLLWTDMEVQGNQSSGELQEAFKEFLVNRKKEKETSERRKAKYAKQRTSKVFQDNLRQRFLERIRHYIGVPYARRFHQPEGCRCEGCSESGRQLYHDDMFLDCCALVRRAVADLRELFGFRLGKWNQAYQFDTLPIRVGRVEQLEPGDLIFWAGDYVNPQAKASPFGMTHVEIFVGGETGEGVIGSRHPYKWVMEYDTYKFESKRWKCKGIYFCKIDTWLQGILRPEHPGLFKGCMEPGRVTKKSIFNEESVQDIAGNRDNGHADLAAMGGHMERDIDLGGPRLHDTTSDSSSDGEDGEEAQSADPPGADAQVMWAAEPEAEASRGLGEWQTT